MTEVSRPPEYARTQEDIGRIQDAGLVDRGKETTLLKTQTAHCGSPPHRWQVSKKRTPPLIPHSRALNPYRGNSTTPIFRNKKSVVASCPWIAIAPPPSRRPSRPLSFSGRLSVQSVTWYPFTQTAKWGPSATIVFVNHLLSSGTTRRAGCRR